MGRKAESDCEVPSTKTERLRFIKKSHQELILEGRDEAMDGFLEGDDVLDSYEASEDIQYIEENYIVNAEV